MPFVGEAERLGLPGRCPESGDRVRGAAVVDRRVTDGHPGGPVLGLASPCGGSRQRKEKEDREEERDGRGFVVFHVVQGLHSRLPGQAARIRHRLQSRACARARFRCWAPFPWPPASASLGSRRTLPRSRPSSRFRAIEKDPSRAQAYDRGCLRVKMGKRGMTDLDKWLEYDPIRARRPDLDCCCFGERAPTQVPGGSGKLAEEGGVISPRSVRRRACLVPGSADEERLAGTLGRVWKLCKPRPGFPPPLKRYLAQAPFICGSAKGGRRCDGGALLPWCAEAFFNRALILGIPAVCEAVSAMKRGGTSSGGRNCEAEGCADRNWWPNEAGPGFYALLSWRLRRRSAPTTGSSRRKDIGTSAGIPDQPTYEEAVRVRDANFASTVRIEMTAEDPAREGAAAPVGGGSGDPMVDAMRPCSWTRRACSAGAWKTVRRSAGEGAPRTCGSGSPVAGGAGGAPRARAAVQATCPRRRRASWPTCANSAAKIVAPEGDQTGVRRRRMSRPGTRPAPDGTSYFGIGGGRRLRGAAAHRSDGLDLRHVRAGPLSSSWRPPHRRRTGRS